MKQSGLQNLEHERFFGNASAFGKSESAEYPTANSLHPPKKSNSTEYPTVTTAAIGVF